MVASRHNFPLLEELLAEQQRLATPVAKFSELHEQPAAPALAAVYRDLIPLSAPKAGEQYAFEVELDACTGCKACVSACHSLNGLDESETWRDVGLVVGGDWRESFQQTVTSACHHCADPACLNGCPVLAYEKDPITGIVRHLDDQCIGCQYCVLKCPYDVPKYNARLGIVRKCDMCHGRLAEGEAPACVQACPTHAIRIVTVSTAATMAAATSAGESEREGEGVRRVGEEPVVDAMTSAFSKSAPAPDYTRPTTRYVSRRTQPGDLHAADVAVLRPQPPHWPLAMALTLLPLAMGGQLLATGLNLGFMRATERESVTCYVTLWSGLVGWVALAVTAAHLGKPMRAWRIFLGWRKSWLSREAMVLGGWAGVAACAVKWPMWLPVASGIGLVGLACSAMIYVDTRRVFWRATQTVPRLFGSVITLGAAAAIGFGVEASASAGVLAAVTLAKLTCDARAARPAWEADDDAPPTAALRTARLLTGVLRPIFGGRVVAALVAGALLPGMLLAGVLPWEARWWILGGVLASDLAERYLFFRAVDAPKMPGLYA